MLRTTRCLILAGLTLCAASVAGAQAPLITRFEPLAGPAALAERSQQAAADSTRHIRETHWQTGAIAGAIMVGLFFAGVAHGFCQTSDVGRSCLGPIVVAALMGGAAGFGVGGLVGGLFPKEAP